MISETLVTVESKVTNPSASSYEKVALRTPSILSTTTRAAVAQPLQVMPVTASAAPV